MINTKFVLGLALASLTMFQASARCPANAENSGHYVTLTAVTTNGVPIGSRVLTAGEEIVFMVAMVYIPSYPVDNLPLSAFGDGQLLLEISGRRFDVTPPGGIPFIGPPECGAEPRFFSQPLNHIVTLPEAAAGALVVRAIYTNGLAELDSFLPIWTVNNVVIGTVPSAFQGPAAPPLAARSAASMFRLASKPLLSRRSRAASRKRNALIARRHVRNQAVIARAQP